MDVRLSADEVALREAATTVARRFGPTMVSEFDDEARVERLDAAIRSAGWRELRCPDETGAPWGSAVAVAVIAEEMSRHLVDAPFVGPTMAAELRRRAGAEPSHQDETVLLTPDLRTVAKDPIRAVAIDARVAATGLLALPWGRGFSLATAGLGPSEVSDDLTCHRALVAEDSVPEHCSTERGLTPLDLVGWSAFVTAITCADLIGSMRGALDLTAEYAKQRQQYGRSIGSFQAVQHMLADALARIEGSRGAAWHAAWASDSLPPAEALAAASSSKAYCARAARAVCETAIQVHGGIGNVWECRAHVHLRRVFFATDLLGGVGVCLSRVLNHHGIGAGDGLQ